jgi:uncharacterized protein (DUF4415 family)
MRRIFPEAPDKVYPPFVSIRITRPKRGILDAPAAEAVSYQHGGRSLMNDDTSGITPKTDPKTDWPRLRSLTDEEIHAAIIEDPDAKATDEGFWKEAHVVMPRRKETVTMRLDADLLEWFRRERGYQTRINAILRAYINAQANHP